MKKKSKITEKEKKEILEYEYLVKQLRENFEEILSSKALDYNDLLEIKNRGHHADEWRYDV